jgi:hypothetical protein
VDLSPLSTCFSITYKLLVVPPRQKNTRYSELGLARHTM